MYAKYTYSNDYNLSYEAINVVLMTALHKTVD